MTRVFILITAVFISVSALSQNKKILYGFAEIPQSLMMNPGSEIDYQWHAGIPLLSGLYAHAGLTGLTISDVFLNDGIDVNTKLNLALAKMDNQDFYAVNQQMEVFNVGLRMANKKDYLSFGFYQEFDGILYHPKELINLAQQGNQDFTQTFSLNDLKFKMELLGVYHFGITRKLNEKMTIGSRVKLYSSVYNMNSTKNTGLLVSRLGDDNIYNSRLQGVNFEVNTSGIIHNRQSVMERNAKIGHFLGSGNMGIGLDFGLTYHINKNTVVTGSFEDLGFVRHTRQTTTYAIKGTQEFDGLNLLFPTNGTIDYLNEVQNELPLIEGAQKYTTLRPLKVHGSLAYQFGEAKDNSCLRTNYVDTHRNEIGLQLFSVFRPRRPQGAATIYYYRRIAKFLKAKMTYTVDEYSATNFGLGFSTHIGMFNMYGSVDNVLGLSDLSKSNNQTINFGMNIIMDHNTSKP